MHLYADRVKNIIHKLLIKHQKSKNIIYQNWSTSNVCKQIVVMDFQSFKLFLIYYIPTYEPRIKIVQYKAIKILNFMNS